MKPGKTLKPNPRADHMRAIAQIQDDAAALAGVPASAWAVLERRFATAFEDAQVALMEPAVAANDRDWLAGGAYHLGELRRQLNDLRTGQWKEWPGIGLRERKTEEEAGDE